MAEITIQKAEDDLQLAQIAVLAKLIWEQHYTSLIGEKQVSYMIDKFQSFPAMKEQVADGYLYFGVYTDQQLCGYFSVQVRNKELFLSKYYVDAGYRGLGIGSKCMKFIEALAKSLDCNSISLTVNKGNNLAIAVYEKLGFDCIKPVVFDIGEGFIMDDYLFVKRLKTNYSQS